MVPRSTMVSYDADHTCSRSRKGKLTHGTERPSPKSAEDERRLFPGKYKYVMSC